ncbi:hypothetical protein A2348_00155 [Candidatus Uhrbacteria bacterium RIFOXYB12_FULL_58_10]|uniref:DUF2325 domain-containing protein n=1 Tax=Candidatus Uhrbacteria bacterium RIFOXYB2_FULL_57_15 TaxID=1802422 RepID=A0A1F7W789_9BACT|nr:MAG: hypothetical protein A2348_00155 [Candidatus Uhrbacteria bacterium RIFOXYB12_FULL_58_10]OGL98640.1 MAG: hypothetical protein A2304_02965 [Candidatus Uhrbacteria bacterium RIFOXYB2_FULL_57_15]OGL99987.1 MAG: hypothetical protein A2501_02610 [Candidatus Uhrbacteria bacterium RIFOXYC12_FULL_57_11]
MQEELEDLLVQLARLISLAADKGFELRFVPVVSKTGTILSKAEPPIESPMEPESQVAMLPTEPPSEPLRLHVCVLPEIRPSHPSSEQAGWLEALWAFLPRMYQPFSSMADEVNDLSKLILGEEFLRSFPNHAQVLLLQYAVARVRHGQSLGLSDADALPIISAVGKYAQRTRIGFVYGPMRSHGPRHGSWKEDAQAYLDELTDIASAWPDGSVMPGRLMRLLETAVLDADPLGDVLAALGAAIRGGVSQSDPRIVRLLDPFVEDLDATAQYKTLRAAIRAARKESLVVPVNPIDESALIPEDWPWLAFTRGKRAVMVGGDPREPNRIRIQRAFGFAELLWEPSGGRRNSLQQVRDRVTGGGVDFVILLRRFIGHDVDKVVLPACREAGVSWISVSAGYGIVRIRQEIERMIAKPL